jgi:pimeloyl-ACP methyl ester carboxylesterase
MRFRIKAIFLAFGVSFGIAGAPSKAMSQKFKDLHSSSPLVLKAQGSFFIGGETVEESQAELGGFGPAGRITVNQMYVRYMIPVARVSKVPLVMIHGMTLTGKTWETTPDGRMGWDEYFVRKGHPVYVPDQVSRGRSGFDPSMFNDVRLGKRKPEEQTAMLRFSDEVVWPDFRIGLKSGSPFDDEQYPVAALGELSKQAVPDLTGILPPANPSYAALSELASQLDGAVMMGHSQGGAFPLEAALLNPAAVKGMILLEPGRCSSQYSDMQILALSKAPILVVFGDHLDVPTGIPGFSWQAAFEGCQAFVARVNGAGGKAEMMHLPERGMHGNSHMLMQDRNSFEIADLILQWIDRNVSKRGVSKAQSYSSHRLPASASTAKSSR